MTAHIIKRKTQAGENRYVVRYRYPGSARLLQWATFRSRKAAEAACAHIEGCFARGEQPVRATPPKPKAPPLTLARVFAAELARPGRGKSAHKRLRQAAATLGPLGDVPVMDVRPSHLRDWIDSVADRSPSTVRQYLGEIRRMLDHADLPHANPALHPTVKVGRPMPKRKADAVSYREFCAIVETVSPQERYRWPLIFMERTGLRISEMRTLRWGDVDLAGGRIRIVKSEKSDAARRWVPLTAEIIEHLEELLPLEDRLHDRRLFPDLPESSFDQALRRAAKFCRQPAYSAHRFRHRYASLLVLAGVPVQLAVSILGHEDAAMTLNTYGHMLLDEPQWRLDELREAVGRMTGLAVERSREEHARTEVE